MYAGHRVEAESYVDQVLSITRELQLTDKVASANVRGGRVAFEAADYKTARAQLTEALQAITDDEFRIEGLINLARVDTRMGNFGAAREEIAKASTALQGRESVLGRQLRLAEGELAYEMNQLEAARTTLKAGAPVKVADEGDAASVESRAYLGLLDALAGQAAGRPAIDSCLDYARNMGRSLLEARCRVFAARVDVEAGGSRKHSRP